MLMLVCVQGAAGQDYDPLYAPGGVWSLWAYCYDWDGQLIANCDIAVNADAYDNSGGHFHNSNRPVSLVSRFYHSFTDVLFTNTGPYGRTIVYFKQPLVGEAEILWNCPVGYYGGTLCGSHTFGVGYSPIYYVSEKPEWVHVGATGSFQHGSNAYNHWMTCEGAWGIYWSAQHYLTHTNPNHPTGKLAVNDMALPFGGIFDIYLSWSGPHFNHSYGGAVDVRGNNAVHAIPSAYLTDFEEICEAFGASTGPTGVHSPGTSNQHVHCEWAPEFQTPPYPNGPCYAGN